MVPGFIQDPMQSAQADAALLQGEAMHGLHTTFCMLGPLHIQSCNYLVQSYQL